MRGKIKWFDAQKGYGFITTDDGKEVFLHFSSIKKGRTYIGLDKEDTVEFEMGSNKKGPQAVNVNLVEEDSAPEVAETVQPECVEESAEAVVEAETVYADVEPSREVVQ